VAVVWAVNFSNNQTTPFARQFRLRLDITGTTPGTLSYRLEINPLSSNVASSYGSGTYSLNINGAIATNVGFSFDFRNNTQTTKVLRTGTLTTTATAVGTSGSATAGILGSASGSGTYTNAPPPPPAPTTPVWSTDTTLSTATVGTSYSATVSASPVTGYALTGFSGATGGFNVDNNTISGTPTTAGTASFTFRASNSNGTATATADRTFSITVNAAPAVWSTTSFTEDVRVGTPYTKTIAATGIRGTSPYSLVGGSTVLPAGLALNTSTGVIAGTPSAGASQTFNFTVNAFNSSGVSTVSETFTLNRRQPLPVWSDETLGRPRVDVAYSDQVTATNAAATNAYSVVGLTGTGLALNANTGAITGTVTSTSTFSFTITARNADGATIQKDYTLTPLARLATWSDQILTTTTVKVNQPYTDGVAATNAASYALETAGTLPPGILLNTGSGAITGTPTTPGTYNFRVVASNASTPTAETITTGQLTILVEPSAGGSVWNGTAWVPSVFKVWNGSIWEEAPVKVWNGSIWADPTN
jgi:hypothetical protein